jgi:tRNA-dependent cyclodipeptide synthase
MKIQKIYNVSKEEIGSKEFNIFIPICLGNKFFTNKSGITENIRKYIEWALDNTKQKVLILVVDKIQDTNYFVRAKRSSFERSLRKVLEEGADIKEGIQKNILQKASKQNRDSLDVVSFIEYEKTDPYCRKVTGMLYDEFENNSDFRESVLATVKSSVTDREFSEEEYLRLCEYVLDEFALAYNGVEHGDTFYGLYIYPFADAALELIEGIKSGDKFPELREKLPKRTVGVAIVNE